MNSVTQFLAVLASVISFANPLFAQASRIHDSQSAALDGEIQRLAVFFDLNEERQSEIKESCLDRLAEEVAKLEAEKSKRSDRTPEFLMRYKTKTLTPSFLEYVRDRTKDRLPEHEKPKMVQYASDANELTEIGIQIRQAEFVATLDNNLCLTKAQEEKIRVLCQSKWQKHWQNASIALTEIGQLQTPSSFFESDGRSILSESQRKLIDHHDFPITLQQYSRLEQRGRRAAPWDVDEFRELCLALLQLKREEINQAKLTESQIQIMRIGEKAATTKVAGRWKAVSDSFQGQIPDSIGMSELIKTPLIVQCMRQPEWQAAVRKVVGQNELERLSVDRKEKLRLSARRIQYLWLTLQLERSTGVFLTLQQYKKMVELFDANIALPKDDQSSAQYYVKLFGVPESGVREIFTPFQWQRAEEWFQKHQSMLGN